VCHQHRGGGLWSWPWFKRQVLGPVLLFKVTVLGSGLGLEVLVLGLVLGIEC